MILIFSGLSNAFSTKRSIHEERAWRLAKFLKLINYSCSSYPTRASYSGQVDGFRNPMKNELKTRSRSKPMFETISNTDANFLNLHIDKATNTRGDKQLYLITHFTKQTWNLNYLLLTLNVTEQFPSASMVWFPHYRPRVALCVAWHQSWLLHMSKDELSGAQIFCLLNSSCTRWSIYFLE